MSRIGKFKSISVFLWCGFTIIEMIVVLAIIGMVLGMSLPYFGRFTSGTQIRGVIRQLSSILYTARSLSITHRKPYAVVLDTTEHEVRIEDPTVSQVVEKRYPIPSTVQFEHPEGLDPITFQDDRIVFTPTGGLEGETGTIWLRDKKGNSMSITVLQSTGKVKVQ